LNTHEAEITAVGHGGSGICRIDGQVCFVPYGLPGDVLRLRIVRQTKGVLWGEIDTVLTPSPDRTTPQCVNFGTCGACTWDHFAYPAQAEWKQRIVRETLARIGGIEVEVAWREDAALRRGYRTRAEFHGDGHRFGFYALGSNTIVDTPQCSLCHPRVNEVLARLRELRPKGSVTVTVDPEGEAQLLWCNRPMPRVKDAFLAVNWPKDRAPRVHFLFDGIPIVNGTFAQASLLLNRLLQAEVHRMLNGATRVLDLYCGNGNLSLGLAGEVEILGIDHNAAVVQAANALAKGRFLQGGEDAFVHALSDEGWDAVLLDPPRTGAKEILPALARSAAARMVYVSCDPATLARDLKALAAGHWRVQEVTVIDLFPHTSHMETVCLLGR
jgi:23S rRNA (uracil1939-C5)-methyltransferase